MMKLKYLFKNEALAEMILKNWAYDPDSLELLQYCRISANAVYPFKSQHKMRFLRFAPVSEKSPEQISAELDFVAYLNNRGYPAVEAIPSKAMNMLETVKTPWGEYLAVVFRGVPGIQFNKTGYSDELLFGYGEALGKLHQLSAEYTPAQNPRWSWKEVLEWVCHTLAGFPGEEAALEEAGLLSKYFSELPVSSQTYGLVHYDFETDNIFYDETTTCYHPIDFDDAMYHWYGMDVEQAIESLKDDIEPDHFEHAVNCFIRGYRSRFELSEEMVARLPVFRRFADLYGYARVLNSTQESWPNEPDWMTNLRGHLKQLLIRRAVHFGEPVRLGTK